MSAWNVYTQIIANLVYDLKSVEALEIEFVAPIPEQITITIVHFSKGVEKCTVSRLYIPDIGLIFRVRLTYL